MAVGTLSSVQAFQDKTSEQMRDRHFAPTMGFVRDRNDPQKLGRIRVYAPAIMPKDSSQSWLDWCLPKGKGIAVPPLNAPVWIEFEHGEVQHGIYTWGFPFAGSDVPNAGKEEDDPTWLDEVTATSTSIGGPISATIPADTAKTTKPKYGLNKVFESEGGFIIEMDDSPGKERLRIYHPKGTTYLIDSDGSVHTRSEGAQYHHCGGDFVVMLKPGSTFKVVYPGGPALSLGAAGLTYAGAQARFMGRNVLRSGEPLGGT